MSENLSQLYPEIEPYNTGTIKVDEEHTLFFEESGNPKGKPVIFLHGGPGGGCQAKVRRFFDPKAYRIILFDQRGCGRSTPHASLNNNTTWHLVSDIEKLREKLNIDKWQVFGGSWGSCLALSYAVTHPDKVTELVLRGIFTLRRKELQWFYQEGGSFIYPDAWDKYRDHIPPEERNDMMTAYYKRLTSDNEKVQMEAAKAWSIWEGSTSYLFTNEDLVRSFGGDKFAIAFARIECHYFINQGFFPYDGWLLDQVDKIRHIPTVIAQGRYDVVCPMETAWELHKRFPEAKFHIIQNAGHNPFEPGTTDILIKATNQFR